MNTGKATIIDVSQPFQDSAEAAGWLAGAGEEDLEKSLKALNHALHALRLVLADPYINPIGRRQLLVARVGYGAGEQVADGRWTEARELVLRAQRQPRQKVLQPQARLAALLTGRDRALVCEELALRVRLDLQAGREREAALGLLVGLDAALAELPADRTAAELRERLEELRGQRDPVAAAAQAALAGPLDQQEREAVAFTVGRIEAALRARSVANS